MIAIQQNRPSKSRSARKPAKKHTKFRRDTEACEEFDRQFPPLKFLRTMPNGHTEIGQIPDPRAYLARMALQNQSVVGMQITPLEAEPLAWYEATHAVVVVTPRPDWMPESAADAPPAEGRGYPVTADAAQAIAGRFNTRALLRGGSPEQWAVVVPIPCAAVESPVSIASGCDEGGDA